MLTRLWQELEYGIDVCHVEVRVWQELAYRIDVFRVTHGAHIEHL